MQTIPLSEIKIENRQRREFDEDKLVELSESIQDKGLLHAPVLQNDQQTLIAGERRLRAISMLYDFDIPITHNGVQLPLNHIPFVTVGDLTDEQIIEAELEENVLRDDLTWQEHADAVKKLHELRALQSDTGAQAIKQTATEILGKPAEGSQIQSVRDDILLARAMESDGDIAKAKSKKEAMKILRKKATEEHNAKLAATFDLSKSPHTFYNGDFRKHLPAPNSIDVILTDPPYGIGAHDFGDMADAVHNYEDSPEYFDEIMGEFFSLSWSVTKDLAHAYVFCDLRYFNYIANGLRDVGWYVWPTPLIWSKGNQGMLPRPDHGPRRTYEPCVYAIKGDKPVTAVYADVITIPGLQRPAFGAEKPVGLYTDLLRRSTRPTDTVWDPFAGAGPIFPAANRCSVTVHATELSPEKYNHAKLRLNEEVDDGL